MTGAVVNVTGDTELINGGIDLNDTQLTTEWLQRHHSV